MSNPSWRQLAQINESSLKARILHALDITPPPEGVSRRFCEEGWYVERTEDGWVVYHSRLDLPPASFGFPADQGSAALKAARCPAGIPTGDALRQFMRRWGWVPKSEQRQAEPNDNTRTVI